MSFTVFIGALTLSPAVAALVLLGIARFSPEARRAALAVSALGALLPAVFLLLLLPDLAYGSVLQTSLVWGLVGKQPIWFAPGLRVESFAVLAAFALAFLAEPLLLWMAWRTRTGAEAAADDAEDGSAPASNADAALASADDDIVGAENVSLARARSGAWSFDPHLTSVALALGIESAGLMVCFADNILWLGLMWTVLAALIWGLGEVGTADGAYDWRGLIAMVAGPILWTATVILVAAPFGAARLFDLMGSSGIPAIKVVLVAVALALASGAYPFTAWLRRRAAFTPPAGLAALLVIGTPAALFIAARTFGALTDNASSWTRLGATTPPVTIGIVFALFGGVTIAINGVLALGRRDSRSLLALLASAQIGWGLLTIGVGTPASVIALIFLLASVLLGLGAMVAALHAGGVITADIEPESAGPRAEGAPQRPLLLFAWAVGGLSLIGMPLLAGFSPRQLVTAAALHDVRLAIPLIALAWGGDLLLLVAFARATIPAFVATFSTAFSPSVVADETAGVTIETVADAGAADVADAESEDEALMGASTGEQFVYERIDAVPAAFGALALLLGIAPQVFLVWTALPAAATLLQVGMANGSVSPGPLGYGAAGGAWLPTAAWIVVVLLALVVAALRFGTVRTSQPLVLAGQDAEALAELAGNDAGNTLAAPVDAWGEFKPAFVSSVAVPAYGLLLAGVEDEAALDEEAGDDGAEIEEIAAEADDSGIVDNDAAEAAGDKSAQGIAPRRRGDTSGKGQA